MGKSCIDHGQATEYGRSRMVINGKTVNTTAHRRVFYRHNGYLPEVVRHSCDNPRCINPEHLLPGTQQDNMQDRLQRGRWAGGRPAALNTEQCEAIRQSTLTQRVLAAQYGVSQATISNVKRG